MKQELTFKQGSAEWLAFRRNYRMASETPGIMGLSPYLTPASVRAEKLAAKAVFVNNAMKQGTEQEPIARAWYVALYDSMRPAVYLDGEYGCSLDGISIHEDVILEIKTPYLGASRSDRLQLAQRGELRPDDYAQVQHQLMVTGALYADFLVWDTKNQCGIMCDVAPDPDYWLRIRAAWDEFWPTIQEREDALWVITAQRYLQAKLDFDEAETTLEEAKAAMIALAVGDFSHGCGVEVRKVNRIGQVDWKEVKEKHLADVDLESFRKSGTSLYQVKVMT